MDNSRNRLRLIRTPPADGFTNMAVDEAVLQAHAEGWAPPTLRLYAWRPPAISTGYFQRVSRDVDLGACSRAGIHVVRRLTGGRAVLHDDEITYSIVVSEAVLAAWAAGTRCSVAGGPPGVLPDAPAPSAVREDGRPQAPEHRVSYPVPKPPNCGHGLETGPNEDPRDLRQSAICNLQSAIPLDLLASYRLLSGGVVAGLRRLGLDAYLAPGQRAHTGPSGADCFAAAARCDLVVGGRKICGSAQLRRAGMILQHGSLPFSLPDPSPYWREPGPPPNAADLTEALGYRPEADAVTTALAAGFAEALGVCVTPSDLTPEERRLAEALRREKYATDDWNLRR